jgi:hypothetical protein
VVHSLRADQRKRSLADPPPENNVLLMAVCLQTLFCLKVEQLQRSSLRLQSNNRLSQVHNRTVCADRSANDIVCVLQVDDDGLGGGVGIVDLAHANVLVGLESLERGSAVDSVVQIRSIWCLHSFAMILMLAVVHVSSLPLGLTSTGSLV